MDDPLFRPSMQRRNFLGALSVGTVLSVLGGGAWAIADEDQAAKARAMRRPDGRPRLPPGQYLLERIRPMGGSEGNPSPSAFKLKVYGEVDNPVELSFADLLAMPQVEQTCDVHCVTKWTVLDSKWTGIRVSEIAQRVRPKASARYVIFEAAEGYTANLPIREALVPSVLVAHRYEGSPLARPHGPPARVIVPDLYFWKSAKWLSAIRFSSVDRPGYWETRGYHNHADPWLEERYG